MARIGKIARKAKANELSTPELMISAYNRAGTIAAAAASLNVSPQAFQNAMRKHQLVIRRFSVLEKVQS